MDIQFYTLVGKKKTEKGCFSGTTGAGKIDKLTSFDPKGDILQDHIGIIITFT
jgi:hypothetical protein